MKDLKTARFESCETECSCSRRIRQGSVKAPTRWMKLAKCILWNVEDQMKLGIHGDPAGRTKKAKMLRFNSTSKSGIEQTRAA